MRFDTGFSLSHRPHLNRKNRKKKKTQYVRFLTSSLLAARQLLSQSAMNYETYSLANKKDMLKKVSSEISNLISDDF